MAGEEDFAPVVEGLQAALDRLVAARNARGVPHADPELSLDLPDALPETGVGGRAALEGLAGLALEQVSRLDHPGFFAHMDPPTPWMTWATSAWAAAMNQNLLHPDTAPAARQLEALVIDWLAPAFGMRGGHLTAGSTLGNLTALWAARELTGARRVVCSAAAHVSIPKACRILGLDLVQVPVDDRQRLKAELLPDDLSDAILVLVAGTVATGAVDPLDTAATGAAWRHVDAAWAGPLRLCAHAARLDGIEGAESVAMSAHKWLYQPKGTALVLFREPQAAHDAVSFGSSYLAAPNIGLLGSRGDAALSLAVTLLAWGRTGVAERIETAVHLADQLADLIDVAPELELWQRPVTGVVNWRPKDIAPERLRPHVQGAWVSLRHHRVNLVPLRLRQPPGRSRPCRRRHHQSHPRGTVTPHQRNPGDGYGQRMHRRRVRLARNRKTIPSETDRRAAGERRPGVRRSFGLREGAGGVGPLVQLPV